VTVTLLLLRGSLTVFRRRCGKPSCRCADGDPHENPALSYTAGGRSKTLTLSAAEVAEVTAALQRYERRGRSWRLPPTRGSPRCARSSATLVTMKRSAPLVTVRACIG